MPASKTAKHKETNKHRFLTFSERLSQVSINAVHRIKREDENDKDEDSKFRTSIIKWRDQDRSLQFQEFLSEISSQSQNYRMIVHYKDEIVSSLLKHLATRDSLALQALCELLVSLCMDLRSDFYPHFKDTFLILTKLMNTKDVDSLEWIFNAISLVFKYLWRYMIADINSILVLYKGLISGEHPVHIRDFAAESITFLIRKAYSKEDFFPGLFRAFGGDQKSQEGLGKVLFYVMKGVNRSLYSRTEIIFPQLLSCLGDEDLRTSGVFESIDSALTLLASHVEKDQSKIIWETILSKLQQGNIVETGYILKYINTWCSHGNGVLILEPEKLVQILEDFCYQSCSEEDRIDLLALYENLTSAKSENFADYLKIRLVNAVISSKRFPPELLLELWKKTISFVKRNTDARRMMLKFCQVELPSATEGILHLLCNYILSNCTLPNDAKELTEYQPFSIDFALISRDDDVVKIQDSLMKILLDENSKISMLWMALLVLQHIRPVPSAHMKMMSSLFEKLSSDIHNAGSPDLHLAAIRMLLETSVILDGRKKQNKNLLLSVLKFLLTFYADGNIQDQNALFMLDIISTVNRDVIPAVANHPNLISNLCCNLSSHDPVVRMFSLRILSTLHPDEQIFKTCLLVEETPATIQTYRSKVLHLGKLKYSPHESPQVMNAALKFLISNLYINFSMYWPLVQEKICSFLPKDGSNPLWTLFFDLLGEASRIVEVLRTDGKSENTSDSSLEESPAGNLFIENGLKITFSTQANVKVDHFNYRRLLWKTLTLLPVEILERNNRHIVTLFLNFIENEYYIIDKSYAPYQNLLGKVHRKNNSNESKVFGKNHCIKTLNMYLQVLAKFKNPVATFSVAKLRLIYEDLLMHGDAEVQKYALKCLLGFKEKNLMAFEEQLFSLLDDDKIKETMVQFNLEEIEKIKRESLIPILFRLMYGRIISKAGVGGQPRKRRTTVLRFFSGLNQDEMQAFIFLAIKPVEHYVDKSILMEALDEKFDIGYELTEVVPLSRQHGILNTVSEIIGKHANLLSKYMLDFLLKLLLSLHLSYYRMIAAIESLEDSSNFQHTVSFLRNLGKQSHTTVNSLIEAWPESALLSSEQIRSLFFVLVDPHIHKLHHECISQPNSLLYLFDEFSKQPKFVPILAQKTTADGVSAPIQVIIKTLVSEKTSVQVTKFIMEMLVRLLGDEEIDDTLAEVEDVPVANMLANVNSCIIDTHNIATSEVGLKLMVNYVGEILKYFINKLKHKNNSAVLVQSHIRLLTSLGEHITDLDLSNELAELVLTHLSGVARAGRTAGSASEQQTIYPALASLAAIPLSTSSMPVIAKLFSRIRSRKCRLLLVQVYQKACCGISGKFGETLKSVSSIISDLNAWDKRFIEELDYDSRLAGFQEVIDWLEGGYVKSLFQHEYCGLLSLVHNCIFTLENHSDDLSLRDMPSRALELTICLSFKYSAEFSDLYHTVVSTTILPGIKRGLNSSDENQRHEWLRLLIAIAKYAPDDNVFSNLKVLFNETDPDADFFANVQHIQMHRRTRAFRKLSQIILDFESTIPYSMVTYYMLPLAIQTIKCKDLTKHLHLRDACLEVVSACAKIMPWPAYARFLRQNMTFIMRHSQGVKIVCSILYSFHFDISSVPDEKAISWEESFISVRAKAADKVEDADDVEGDPKPVVKMDEEETAAIYSSVVCDILPRLCRSLSGKLNSDSSHKLADSQNFSDIDQCTIRAPLAVAVVSLLRKLPNRILRLQLSTVILKIVAFLRHHFTEVRSAASKVIVQIVQLLEPIHITVILKELKGGLARGYQKHVLMHTVNAIFSQIEGTLNIGDLAKCTGLVLSIVNDDLFGKGEEERGIEQIKSKLPEARGRSKAYNLYKIMAKFSKKESLISIITPLKNILDFTHDHKKRRIIESVLEEIHLGLQANTGLTAEDVMVFLHGLLTENLPGIFRGDAEERERKKRKPGLQLESCFLLSTEPERYGIKQTKKTQKTNLHLLIEFSLRLLNSSLKHQMIKLTKTEHLQMLDPFVKILKHCLDSAHSKTVTEAIRCLTKLLRSSLPSLQENAVDIIKCLFKVLRENSRGTTNHELAAATYKALSILCSSDIGSKLTDTQLQVLLGYAEEMLYERDRQSHAFTVIQSILSRGLKCAEVVEVMNKIRDICIQTHDTGAMVHSRQVYIYFLNNYPMTETKLLRHLEFVLAQLSFEYESGRISSLELLASIVNSIPENIFKSHSGTIFVPLSAMLVNDESVKCRKLAAYVIKVILDKLQTENKDQLFSLVLQWYCDEEQPLHQQLAAMLVCIFAEAEETAFHRNLSELIPAMSKVLTSVVETLELQKDDDETESHQKDDYFIFHQLSALHTVLRSCRLIRDPAWKEQVSSLLCCVERLLLHPHMWIRIATSQIFGTVLASWNPQEFANSQASKELPYFAKLQAKIRILTTRFCQQIRSPLLDPKLADQCIKNLLFIIRVHDKAKGAISPGINADVDLDLETPCLTAEPILFLLSRLLKTAKQEAANNIKETSKRTSILKFYAAACLALDDIENYLPIMTELIYRESERKIVEEDKDAMGLKLLAGEVLEVVKTKVGSDMLTRIYASVRKEITTSRRERKRLRDVELVADPQRAAASKRHHQQKKKDQRKRKIASFRPEYGAKLKKKKV